VGKTVGIAKLKTGLLREVDGLLEGAGFRRVRDHFYGDNYYREASGVRHGISIGAGIYVPNVLEAAVGGVTVRFHDVEALVAQIEDPHPLINARAVAGRPTLFVDVSESDRAAKQLLRSWGGTARRVWHVHSQEDVPRAAYEIATLALEKGEPLFAALSDPRRALEILSGDDDEARTYAAPDEVRAMKAIAVAFLLDGESAARELARAKLGRMKGDAVGAFCRATERLFDRRMTVE
jgi:hypothetical protein